tara:strand:+ start:41393 stop:41764 length:372 start_codon:yes stop_codon:yes gene_type:complete
MTYAYWYLLIVIFLPYFFTILAKSKSGYNNSEPREFLESVEGWRKRSHWVQLNSYEILPPFIAGIIIAHQLHAPQDRIDILALTFLGCRILYGFFYLFDKSLLRSLSWLGSLICVVGFFVISI